MKLLGKRSLSSFLEILLDIGFYGIFIALVLLTVAVLVARRSDNVNNSQNFGVFFDLDPAFYEIEPSAGPQVESTGRRAVPGRSARRARWSQPHTWSRSHSRFARSIAWLKRASSRMLLKFESCSERKG